MITSFSKLTLCPLLTVVQVVQHSQAAAASVANEIDLMMGFHHPNLVSAYHFVTWRRRKSRLLHHSGDQVRATISTCVCMCHD